ncbi:MAG: hypothetical protein H0U60_20025 [Blastocatellia bacterium]|nr:hypothetical protein [Blastocatellia bacterium]
MSKKYDAIAVASERYGLAIENQRPKFDKFNDFDYIFHSRLKKYDPNVASKVFNPIIWSFIETIISRLLAKKPIIAYKPRERDDEGQSDILSELFSYWFDKSSAWGNLADFIKQALIYGTGILKVDWYTSPERTVKSYVTDEVTGEAYLDENGEFIVEETTVTDYDDPRIQNVNIYDFFFDPNATSVDDAEWVIHQYYSTVSELEAANQNEEKPVYDKKSLKELRDYADGKPRSDQEAYENERRAASGYTNTDHTRGKGRVKIWEMWSRDNDGIKLCVIADEYLVLREGPSPYWHDKFPFIRFIDSSNTLEFYGKGEIEPVEKMVHALNTLMNQRITNLNQILSPVWKARGNVDDTELQFIPNSIIHLNDMNDVDILRQNDVTGSSFQEQGVIIEQIQRALGVTDYTQGLQTPGQTKAEVEIKTAQANARFSTKLLNFEEMALKRLGEIVYSLYQQYITSEKIVRVTGTKGERFVRVTPADLVGRYDVIPESGSTLETDEEAKFRKAFNLAGYLDTKPFINQIENTKRVIELSGEKDPESLFLKGDENAGAIGQLQGLGLDGAPIPTGQPQGDLGVGEIL